GNVLVRSRHEIQNEARDLFRQSNLTMIHEKQLHDTFIYKLRSMARSFIGNQKQLVGQRASTLGKASVSFVRLQNTGLANVEKTVANLHPDNVLKRGYAIARVNGKVITRAEQVQPSDEIETVLMDGIILSTANSVKSNKQ